MKIWIFSVVVHLLLLWTLSLVLIPAPKQPATSAVIQTYSYTPVRTTPEPAVTAEPSPVLQNNKPEPGIQAAKKRAVNQKKAAGTTTPDADRAFNSGPDSSTTAEVVTANPAHTRETRSLAERALAAVSAKAAEPVVQRQYQREVVVNSGSAAEGELAPAMLQKVKTYADGSELVKGVHGCWKVPPAESRKGATWMMTSTPCETDTTVEQINDILQKRRTYADH